MESGAALGGASGETVVAPVRRAHAGRPRDPKVDEAVLAAALDLLGHAGYRRLTVDAVARRAGVSRTTLRLRWRTKAELVFDAVFPDAEKLAVPDTGSLEGDLRGCIANTVAVFESAEVGAAFQGLVDDCRHEPEVAKAILNRIYAPSLEGFQRLVERGIERGEITSAIDADVLFDVIAGSVLYRLSVSTLDLGRLESQLVSLLCAAMGSPAPTTKSSTAETKRRAMPRRPNEEQ
jgi:AcrR family transcriptional regulator